MRRKLVTLYLKYLLKPTLFLILGAVFYFEIEGPILKFLKKIGFEPYIPGMLKYILILSLSYAISLIRKVFYWLFIGSIIFLVLPLICLIVLKKYEAQLVNPNNYPLLIFIAVIALFAISFAIMRFYNKNKKTKFVTKTLKEIDSLGDGDPKKGGFLFEEFIASLYQALGYDAKTVATLKKMNLVKTKGFDQGVDVVIDTVENNRPKRAIIQCKLYKNPVGNKAVQEVSAAISLYNADFALVITNNFFTDAAIELAKANNVILIDRNQLALLIEKANQQSGNSLETVSAA